MGSQERKPYVDAWRAFQQDKKKQPVVGMLVMKAVAVNYVPAKVSSLVATPLALFREVVVSEPCKDEVFIFLNDELASARSQETCLHCDLLQSKDSPLKFYVYMVFASSADAEQYRTFLEAKTWQSIPSAEEQPI